MYRFLIRVFSLCLLTLLGASAGLCQNATTSLRGVVTDPTGAVVPGASISLLNKAAGQKLATTSQGSGDYQLLQIAPATYTITVTAPGFGSQTKTAELLVNQPATINFALTLQSTVEVVDVTGGAQTMNTSDASIGNSTNNATIQAMPSATRNIPDLLSLNPGVFFIPIPEGSDPSMQDSRSGSVNGTRSDQSNVTLDGLDDNDQIRGLAFTGVLRATQDSTEEFRVTTSNGNADAGRSAGAQVSLITKSGTNSFHGALYEYHRPTFTVANDFFLKNTQRDTGVANRPAKLIRNIFGGDLGGPIIKNKLFFFGNYEGQRQAESATVQRTAPTALYQQGILQYADANGGVSQLTPEQFTAMDSAPKTGCAVCGTAAYPAGPGPNPNTLAFLNSMPAANGTALGDGLNTGSYTFASTHPITLNTTIVKLDWTPSERHHVFVRGNLQKDTTGGLEQFPGQGPSSNLIDNSKGISAGDTWTVSPTLVNDLRYGYIRQGYAQSGVGKGDYVSFRFLDTPTAQTRSSIVSVPVNNIIDNLNWTKGKHTIEVGGNWRLVHQNLSTDENSYNSASTNTYWLSNNGNPTSPTYVGAPDVDSGFLNSYQIAYSNLVGTVPSVTNAYNYNVSSPTTGTLLAEGAPVSRSYKANEYEYFIQDSWRALPNLTLTFGLRHTILQTPWEVHGQQVQPTIDTDAWYKKREAAATAGSVYEEELQFAPSGPYYGKPGYWPKSKNNFAPRFAVAYAPNSKTSIRAGAGLYYAHYGQGLINSYSKRGSFGLSTTVTSKSATLTDATSPRFTDRNTLPFTNGAGPQTTAFPYQYPDAGAIEPGLDNKIKTPYSEAFDLSFQRELKGGFTIEVAYVGNLGRHLLQTLDLAEPTNYVDPQGGGDYFTAGTQLSKLVDQNAQDSTASVPAIPYFEHVFPFMANFDHPGESATQAIYSNEWAPTRAGAGVTTALTDIDYACQNDPADSPYPCPAGYQSKFWQQQFLSLYSLASIGMSYYNAGQVTLRHPMSHGFQADVSYTFSKSIDMGSDAERTSEFVAGVASPASFIINTWQPYLNRAPSDFDTRHLLTVDYLYALPVGRGQRLLGNTNHLVDAVVGGWQFSGILRATSGLPFGVFEPGWTTNWEIESYGVVTDKHAARVRRHFDSSGNPQFFDNPDAINSGVTTGGPIRLPYPGETGQRNYFRGDGYFDVDSGLSKAWSLSEYGKLKFAWEVYNVTNTVRFDPFSIGAGLTGGNLGTASALLGSPRRMQFSLRYDF